MERESDFRSLWNLDRSCTFLNHGSYGAVPMEQHRLHLHIDSQPVRFFTREMEPLMEAARERLAAFLGADPAGTVFVPNATTGVNTVLKSLDFRPGDEILTTDHVYNACNNAAEFVARKTGANVVAVHVPFPLRSPAVVTERVLGGVTPRTRLLLIDHVTSPTALVFPVAEIVREFRSRGIQVLVDGAHAPGMLPLDLKSLGATYYTGNCHKWMCAPKGSAFLYISEEARSKIRPLTISHGANSTRTDKSFLHLEFDWTGTGDYTQFILLPACIDFLGSVYPGGAGELMRRNHGKAVWAMEYLCEVFDSPAPCPGDMLGSMASVPVLPLAEDPKVPGKSIDPIYDRLFHEFAIEVPVISGPRQEGAWSEYRPRHTTPRPTTGTWRNRCGRSLSDQGPAVGSVSCRLPQAMGPSRPRNRG